MPFGHPHHAGIREGHGNISVFLQQPKDGVRLFAQTKRHVQDAASHQFKHGRLPVGKAPHQKAGFCEDGFAGKQRRYDLSPVMLGPLMIAVVCD